MAFLFSYGTLRDAAVQQATFGRLLIGHDDALVGFAQSLFAVADPAFVQSSGKRDHPIVRYTGQDPARVRGVALEVTDAEWAMADAYEPAGYARVEATL